MNAFIIIGSNHPKYLKSFHDYGDILGYKAQAVDFVEVGKGLVFGSKTRFFVFGLGGSKSHCIKDSFNHSLIRVGNFHKPCGP
jgi:hypothetical protein